MDLVTRSSHSSPTKHSVSNWPVLREKLKNTLLERVESGRLVLPAMPTTAAKVMDCLEGGMNQNRVAALLEQDPALALEVLRLANSGSFGPRARIDSIAHAINLLGATRLRSLLTSAAARQVFISRNRTIRNMTSTLWAQAVGVAVVSRQIAVRAAFPDKELPYLAGLMHNIGKPIAAIYLLDLERSVSRAAQDSWIAPSDWLSIVQEVHRPVGMAVAKAWNLAPEVRKVIHDDVEFDAMDRLSAANAVRFANALAKREGVYVGAVDTEQVETVLLIGRSMLGLDDSAVAALSMALRSAAESAPGGSLSP